MSPEADSKYYVVGSNKLVTIGMCPSQNQVDSFET